MVNKESYILCASCVVTRNWMCVCISVFGGGCVLQCCYQSPVSTNPPMPPPLPHSTALCARDIGASVFLELAQMDFTSRHAMMDSYSEIKRMYKAGASNGASRSSRDGAAGSGIESNPNSPNHARREHLRLRQEMFPRAEREGGGRGNRLGEQVSRSYSRGMLALGTIGFFLLGFTRSNKS